MRYEITPGSRPNPTPGCVSFAISNRRPVIPATQLRDDIEPRTYAPQGPRTFDPKLNCWVADAPVCPEIELPRYRTAKPESTPHGNWYVVYEWDHRTRRLGQPVWTFRQPSMDDAIAEKTRLCREAGYKPGWCRVRELNFG